MEVDHRAKNVLAVVESVVRLSNADDPAKYAAAIQHRVQALSIAHTLLSESGWNPVRLKDVAETQINRYRKSSVEMVGPDISVPAVVVQPLALVFHELISNAAAHGALSKPGGRLSLNWEKQGDNGGFVLTWTEQGVAPPEFKTKNGFGTVMVKAVVEKQLLGRLRRDWDDDVLRIAIEVPGQSVA
jgi:two-component sensor histidine kinase